MRGALGSGNINLSLIIFNERAHFFGFVLSIFWTLGGLIFFDISTEPRGLGVGWGRRAFSL